MFIKTVKRCVCAFSALFLSYSAYSIDLNKPVSFMPENDLHFEDDAFTSNVSREMFFKIIETAREEYQAEANSFNEDLIINAKWDDATVNANARRYNGELTINMYGGLARREEVTPAGFALVVCHELGHGYGGTPYIRVPSKIAAEGQADYYGADICLERVVDKLKDEFLLFSDPSDFILSTCGDDTSCILRLEAGESLGNLLAMLGNEEAPNYETPDQYITRKTLLSYPKTTQCRLDTYFNGVMKMPRPKCWFKN